MAQINLGWNAVGRLQGGSLGEGHARLRLLACDSEGAKREWLTEIVEDLIVQDVFGTSVQELQYPILNI